MKKGEIYEGLVERVDYPNKGITMVDGTAVTVKNVVPGQRIRFMISKKRSGRCEGRLLEVLSPSLLETRGPQCSIFPECGGCLYQTMSYESQLAMKEGQIRRLLENSLQEMEGCCPEYGNAPTIDDIWEGIIGSPSEFEYRNKMEFSFGDAVKDGPLTRKHLGVKVTYRKNKDTAVLRQAKVRRDRAERCHCLAEHYDES